MRKEFSVSNNKMKDQEKRIQHPKMAPQLDGLHCFELICMYLTCAER